MDRVRLTGLRAPPHLNGKQGFVRCLDPMSIDQDGAVNVMLYATGDQQLRYIVRLADGKEVRVLQRVR